MKKLFDKITNSRAVFFINKYCNSIWYIITMGIVCIICHSLNIVVVGALLLTLLVAPALLFCKNTFVLIPFATLCATILNKDATPESGYYNSPLKISALVICLIVLVTAFVFNLTYYKKWKCFCKRRYLTVSLAVLSLALLLGGIFSATYTVQCIITALLIIVTMFVVYVFFMSGEYEGEKTVVRFAVTMITAAIVVSAGYLQLFIENDFNLSAAKDFLLLGYVGPNTGSAIITMAIPMTFYFVYKYKYGFLFMILVALEVCVIALARSRASLVVAAPGAVIVAIAMCFKKKSGRLGYYITCGVFLAAAVACVVLFRNRIFGYIGSIFSGGFTGSGRTGLWVLGWKYLKENPLFGSGLNILQIEGNWYYSFHCTPLTYLYCAGIVGLAAYIYHRYKTVRLVFSAKLTVERVFIALTVLAMLCNALFDIAMTSPLHLMYYSIMLALIECDVDKAKAVSVEKSDETKTGPSSDVPQVNTINNSEGVQ